MRCAQRARQTVRWQLGILAVAFTPLSVSGQVLRGTIRDSASVPIRDAIVAAVDSNARVLASVRTDALGQYRMQLRGPSEVAIFARRLGFVPRRSPFQSLTAADSLTVDLTLSGAVVRLSAVLIKSQRDSIRQTRVFGMDMRTIGGTIITPAQVDQAVLGARDILDVFNHQAVLGFSVDEGRGCIIHERGFPRQCLPAVVDGLLVPDGQALRYMVSPEVIDYMMVLRGHEVGVLFGSVSEEGIVVVVTKNGLKRGPR
ncbi:MAG: carboxypeptidase-like regulatory domain-containing protein [Gemmatimonadaceae bacterium]